jgi:hypothetical protein
MTQPGMSRRQSDAVLIGVFLVVILPGLLGLGAWVVSRSIRFADRPRQAECEYNLKSFFTELRTFQRMDEDLLRDFSRIGWSPERGNRYAYFLGPGPMEDRSGESATGTQEARAIGMDTFKFKGEKSVTFAQLPPHVAGLAGLRGKCPDCDITLICAGNLDADSTLDIWSISTGDRSLDEGELVTAGETFHHVDDIKY